MELKFVFEILSSILMQYLITEKSMAKLHNKLVNHFSCDKYIPTFKVVNTCFKDKAEPIVIITNSSNWNCNKLYGFENEPNLVIRLGLDESDNLDRYINIKKNLKLDPFSPTFKQLPAKIFLLIEFGLNSLTIALHKLKSSKWWNSYGFFIIKCSECKNSFDYLKTIWKFNILSAVFFCTDNNLKTQMYTFNPYSSEAPLNWIEQYGLNITDGQHYITFFKRPYDESAEICNTLNFEKTRVLSSYTVRLCGLSIFYNPNITTECKLEGQLGRIAEAIWSSLNASINLTVVDNNGIIDEDGFPTDTLADVIDGKFDMNTVYDYQRDIWQYELNTFIYSGVCYVTKTEEMEIIEFVMDLLSSPFFITLLVYVVISTLFLVFFLKASPGVVVLDVIRALTGASMMNQPKLFLERLVLTWNVFLWIVMSTYFQSNLFSLFTAIPMHPVDIKTSDDLLPKFKTYAIDYQKQYFINRSIYKEILPVNTFEECISLMYKYKNIACPIDCVLLMKKSLNFNEIAISKDQIIENYFVLVHREDFPLRKRVQQVYSRLYQHGIIKYIRSAIDIFATELKLTRRNISFKDVEFTFIFYIFGVAISLASLVIEVITERLLNIFTKNRVIMI